MRLVAALILALAGCADEHCTVETPTAAYLTSVAVDGEPVSDRITFDVTGRRRLSWDGSRCSGAAQPPVAKLGQAEVADVLERGCQGVGDPPPGSPPHWIETWPTTEFKISTSDGSVGWLEARYVRYLRCP